MGFLRGIISRLVPKAQVLKDPVLDIQKGEPVIALVGLTGVGKSTFINAASASDEPAVEVGTTLKSCTNKIEAVRCFHPNTGQRVVLVDTPGFDNSRKSDYAILKKLARWLKRTYDNRILLTGIIYLHKITDDRMGGSPARNIELLTNLCGDEAIRRVILVTSMWNLGTSLDVKTNRESQLRTRYWSRMLELGSSTARFDRTTESAWQVINAVLGNSHRLGSESGAILVQEEMMTKLLPQTRAGETILQKDSH